MITREQALAYHSEGRPGKLKISPTKPTADPARPRRSPTPPGSPSRAARSRATPTRSSRTPARGNLVAVVTQRHRGARARQPRTARGQARDGGQGGPVQAVRRHRRVRHRDRQPGPRRDRAHRAADRADLRRHQPRGHPRARVLRDRDAPDRERSTSRSSTTISTAPRSSRARRCSTRVAAHRPRARRAQGGGQRRRRGRHRLRATSTAISACPRENITLCDSNGVIYEGRTRGHEPLQGGVRVAAPTRARSPTRCAARTCSSGSRRRASSREEMVRSMADQPIIFAMANPDPEISPDAVRRARPDAIMATGRSRLPEPGEQRARLPVHLPRRARRARAQDQRGDEARRGARAGRARARGEAVPEGGARRLPRRRASTSGRATSSRSRSIRACSCTCRSRWRRPRWRAASRGASSTSRTTRAGSRRRSRTSKAWPRPRRLRAIGSTTRSRRAPRRPRAPRPTSAPTRQALELGLELLERPKRGGGPDRVRTQHAKQRMTVFERIRVLSDREPNLTFQNWGPSLDGASIVTGILDIGGPRRRGLRPRLHAARGLDGRHQRRQARAPDLHGRAIAASR